jgi:bifunctional non-homologous end joining protein LigD
MLAVRFMEQDAAIRTIRKATRPGCPAGAMPLHAVLVSEFRFIPPCRPIPAKAVPAGDGWVHEVKFDGYRVQAHKMGSRVVLFSRNGYDFTERFASIAALLREMPAKAVVLDGEVVASDADGRPNFARLHVRWTRPGAIHLWAFDLLALNGQDLSSQALVKRQARLKALLDRFGCPAVSASETFADGMALLRAAEEHRLEGVVSKRCDAPYRSGDFRDWRKVKTAAWREGTSNGGGCSSRARKSLRWCPLDPRFLSYTS